MTEREFTEEENRILREALRTDKHDVQQKERQKQIDILVDAAQQTAALFHSSDGRAWAEMEVSGHREIWAVRSRRFKQWLLLLFRDAEQTFPGSDTVNRAIDALDALAVEGDEHEVQVRVAGHDGKFYVDLCDKNWRAIEVDTMGWRIVDRPPVRFRRSPAMLPLPVPEKGGRISMLRKYLNVSSNDDFALAVFWLVAALRPQGPYAVLGLSGEHGSAKSTFAKVVRALVDPDCLAIRRPPHDERDLFIAAGNSHVLAFDNVSDIQPWLSDALCTLSTDGAFGTRKLWTDDEEQLFKAKRPIVVNGIANVITAPDLADRALFLALAVVSETSRRTEEELEGEFAADRAKILGVLLNAVAHGLKMAPTIEQPKLPRMADFAHWAMACEGALFAKGTFDRAYKINRTGGVEDALEADPVASAVRTFMDGKTEWTGLTKQLLAALTEIAGDRVAKGRSWPKTERKLTDCLKTAVTFLRHVHLNIVWAKERTNRGREITITQGNYTPATPSPSSPFHENSDTENNINEMSGDGVDSETVTWPNDTVTPSPKTVTRKPLKRKASDGRDGRDGVAGPICPKPAPNIERTHSQVEPSATDGNRNLDIPPFLDRRPQPRQNGKWAGTYVSDDDIEFIESDKFK